MKTTISILVLIFSVIPLSISQNIQDDVYFRPGDIVKQNITTTTIKKSRGETKNGAREIIYIDAKNNRSNLIIAKDTVYLVKEDLVRDSVLIPDTIAEDGYYLNGFQGSKSDYEYAERIRKFHNPKYMIHVSDPQYNDIYFLNSNDWNIYIDDSYAWITPTWTNPYWWDYSYRPYSYNSWYWRNNWYSPYYHSWGYSPWGYDYYGGWGGYYGGYYGGWGGYYGGYYGGWGGYYGGYYGWDYPYYGNWGGYYGGGGYTARNKNYNESTRRDQYYSGNSRITGTSTRISGGSYSNSVSRNPAITSDRDSRSYYTSNGNERTSNTAVRSSGDNNRYVSPRGTINADEVRNYRTVTTPRTTSAYNNDSRTSTSATNRNNATIISSGRGSSEATVRTGTGSSTVRSSSSSYTSSGTSTPRTSSSYSSGYTERSSSQSTYSAPSNSSSYSAPSSSSSSSYSSGSSSRSSGSSYSGGSSGGSYSGGERSSGGGSSSGGRR